MKNDDVIDEKCDRAGCDDKARKWHTHLFVFEHWDVHPPADFLTWMGEKVLYRNEQTKQELMLPRHRGNPVTLWNTDLDRQEFYHWRGMHTAPQPML